MATDQGPICLILNASRAKGNAVSWLNRHADAIAAFAGLVAVVVGMSAVAIGILSVYVANRELQSSRDLQLKTIAQDSFREYLKLAIDEPLFAAGTRACSRNSCKNDEQSYEAFVSYFLHAAEQVYLLYPHDGGWNRALSNHVCRHRDYLSGPDFVGNTSKHYDSSFTKFIATTLPTCRD
jgi:hypothetical protein